MGQDLEITYRVDDRDAKRAYQASIAALAKVEAANKKAADAQQASAKRAADAMLAATQRAQAAAQKSAAAQAAAFQRANERMAAASEKSAQKAAAAAQAAQDKVIAAARRAADAQQQATARALDADLKAAMKRSEASQKAADAQVRAAQKRADFEARAAQKIIDAETARVAKLDQLGRQQLSKEEVLLRARAQANQRFQAQRVDSAAKIMRGEAETESMSDKLAASAGRITAGFVGVGAIEAAFRGISKAIDDSQDNSSKFAESLLKTKDDLAEIATLRGLAFADDAFVRKMAGFSQATGMSLQQADQFQKQLFGSSAGGLQAGNVTEDILDKAAVITGQAATRQTKDFGTAGDLVGMLSQFKNYKVDDKGAPISTDESAKRIAADREAVRLALTEGRGDDAPLTKSLLNIAGSMVGEGMPVADMKQLAAFVGTTSLTAGPLGADTRADQLYRGLRGTTPQQMGFLKDFAKIDEHDNLETRLDKIIPKLREQRAKGRDIGTFLTESGMNDEQSRGLLEQVNGGYEIFKTRAKKARDPVSLKAVTDANEAFDQSALGIQKKGQAALFNAQLEKGKERQALEAEMPAAEAELVKEGLDTNKLSFLPGDTMRNLASGHFMSAITFDQTAARQQRIEQRALDRLRKRAGGGYSPVEIAAGSDRDAFGAPAAMAALGTMTGHDAAGAAAAYYSEMIRMQEAHNTMLEDIAAGKLPANAPAMPGVIPKAPQLMTAAPATRVGP